MVLHGTCWATSESVSWFPRAGLLAAPLCCDLSFRPAEARAPGNAGWLVSADRLLPSCTPGVGLLVLSSQGQSCSQEARCRETAESAFRGS